MVHEDGGEVIPMFNNMLFGARSEVDGLVRLPVLPGLRCGEQLHSPERSPCTCS